MPKLSNFEKLYRFSVDTYEELMEMFSPREIDAINKADSTQTYAVYAIDKIFSEWGRSPGQNNHVLAICWSREQREKVYQGLCEAREMRLVSWCSLDHLIKTRHNRKGTWSIKNANDCPVWNKGIQVEV